MRTALFSAVFLSVALCAQAGAQPSPYGASEGNLGTWSWDKSQAKRAAEGEAREPGETAWERLNAERNAEEAPPPNAEAPKSLSPLEMWRLLRGKNDE